jgi:hypothetical protein
LSKFKNLGYLWLERSTKILRVLPLITLIKNKIKVIKDSLFYLIDKIKRKRKETRKDFEIKFNNIVSYKDSE